MTGLFKRQDPLDHVADRSLILGFHGLVLFLGAVFHLDLHGRGDLGKNLGFAVRLAGVFLGDALQRRGFLFLVDAVAFQAGFFLRQRFSGGGASRAWAAGAENRTTASPVAPRMVLIFI